MLADGAGELDERVELAFAGPGEPRVEVCWRKRGVFELVEHAQLLLEQEAAVERLVGVLHFVQQRELTDRLLRWGFQ